MHWKWECENDQTLQSHTSYLILITCSLHSKAYGFSHTQKIFLALFSVDPCNEKSSRKRKQVPEFHPVKLIKICKVIYHLFIFSFGNRLHVFSRNRSQKTQEKNEFDVQFVQFCGQPIWILQRMTSFKPPIIKHSPPSTLDEYTFKIYPSDVPHILFQDICSSWCFQDKQKKAIGVLSWKFFPSFQ